MLATRDGDRADGGAMTSRLGIRSVLCLALCSLSACGGEPASQTGSGSEALVAPGSLPGRGATPLMITQVDDPLGVGLHPALSGRFDPRQ